MTLFDPKSGRYVDIDLKPAASSSQKGAPKDPKAGDKNQARGQSKGDERNRTQG